jgi:hypothetical protein
MPRTSDIPVGTQFSPALIQLGPFLRALCKHSGDKKAIQEAIFRPPVHLKRTVVPTSRRTASLPLEAAIQYGLLTPRTYVVTELTKRLARFAGSRLYEEFARHILLNRGGLRVIEAIDQMQLDGLKVGADPLSRYLTPQGFRVTEHNTAINTLRMWLEKAGVFSERGWTVNRDAKRNLVPISDGAIAILTGFSSEQRAFVEALCKINPSGWCKASDIRDLAEATSGLRLGRASLPNEVLKPLKRAGLIDYKTGGTSGGKTARLRTTRAFDRRVLEPFITTTVTSLDPVVTGYYKRRPRGIYAALKSTDKFKKGEALEAYAIHIMRLLGLRFVEWRKRGPETGGAEIDAVFSGLVGCVPTVWQVQCKNLSGTGRVDLEDVAKEVGQAPTTRATHVMLIANGRFTRDAEKFSQAPMRSTPLTIFLLGRDDFEVVKKSPGNLGGILRAKAETMVLNRATEARAAPKP